MTVPAPYPYPYPYPFLPYPPYTHFFRILIPIPAKNGAGLGRVFRVRVRLPSLGQMLKRTGRKFHMDARFYRDLLLEEELLEEKSLFDQEKTKAQKENVIWIPEELLVT